MESTIRLSPAQVNQQLAFLETELRRLRVMLEPAIGECVDLVQTEHPYIVMAKGVVGGEPIIRGTRIAVRDIVVRMNQGQTPAAIVEELEHLTLAQVHDALSYYYDHQTLIDEAISINADEDHWKAWLQSSSSLSTPTNT